VANKVASELAISRLNKELYKLHKKLRDSEAIPIYGTRIIMLSILIGFILLFFFASKGAFDYFSLGTVISLVIMLLYVCTVILFTRNFYNRRIDEEPLRKIIREKQHELQHHRSIVADK
jgi:hypothetical protein